MEEKPESFMDFVVKYKGAIIGGIIAILLICTGLFKLLIALIVIAAGILGGNYIQKNKDSVKENIKNFIDKF
jgi:uncharacterized membrane protein